MFLQLLVVLSWWWRAGGHSSFSLWFLPSCVTGVLSFSWPWFLLSDRIARKAAFAFLWWSVCGRHRALCDVVYQGDGLASETASKRIFAVASPGLHRDSSLGGPCILGGGRVPAKQDGSRACPEK